VTDLTGHSAKTDKGLPAYAWQRPQSFTNNAVLRSLPAHELQLVLPKLKQCLVQPGQVLLQRGGPVTAVYFPNTGVISLVASMSNPAAAVTAAMVGNDGAVGAGPALADMPAAVSAVVLIRGTALSVDAQTFRSLARQAPQLRAAIAALAETALGISQQTVACNVLHDISSRLARWLLHARDLEGETLALTQQTLASMLGVQRASVCLAATEFQTAGLISYKRGCITIKDEQALRQAACECYAVSRRLRERFVDSRSSGQVNSS